MQNFQSFIFSDVARRVNNRPSPVKSAQLIVTATVISAADATAAEDSPLLAPGGPPTDEEAVTLGSTAPPMTLSNGKRTFLGLLVSRDRPAVA